MKSTVLTILCAAAGFLLGFGFPKIGKSHLEKEAISRRSARPPANPWGERDLSACARMRQFVSQTATVAPEDWPAFFLARMHDPEGTRLAERLWAERDPQGFWKFLKSRRDAGDLLQYGRNLLPIWAAADPDAAMAAANEITEKHASDFLRREVIDTVLAADLKKGLAFAAAAPDFNRFSWGPRDWISADPAAAAAGLAALPARSEYRDFLKIAVAAWAETDSAALLDWVKRQPVPERDEWFGAAFTAAANADLPAALTAAKEIADPAARDAALAGVVSSGRMPEDQVPELLARLPIPNRQAATLAVLEQAGTSAQIAAATRLLPDAPASKNSLESVGSLAGRISLRDPAQALVWTAALPDAAMRRAALARLAEIGINPDALFAAIANAPRLDLSNDLFRNALRNLPADRRAAWIARLPPDLAAWAEAAAAK